MNDIGIVINKEKNWTSRDVVNKLQSIFQIAKIGHTGTLDPLATGVLVCLTGKYTKLEHLITSFDKEYIAEIKLGIKTDTDDITGKIIQKTNTRNYTRQEIVNVLKLLVGEYTEVVPLYSAVHVNGKRLYEYARSNEEVELPMRVVEIKDIELLSYQNNIIKFRVVVSKGTYIRSLIQTICAKLNTIGTMNNLIRTRQGKFKLEDAYKIEDVENHNFKPLKISDLIDLQIIELPNVLRKKVINGNVLQANLNGYILYQLQGKDIALYHFENNIGKLQILFTF